jgi:hypothetical protein
MDCPHQYKMAGLFWLTPHLTFAAQKGELKVLAGGQVAGCKFQVAVPIAFGSKLKVAGCRQLMVQFN